MPTNKRESLIYTILMCAFMVFWMSVYNMSLAVGFGAAAFREAWLGFPTAYLTAILCDWFLVSGAAKGLAFRMVRPDSPPLAKIVAISCCMVCGMVLLMSLYGAVEQNGLCRELPLLWLRNIPRNFVMALPLQLLVAGPFIRRVFAILCPPRAAEA